MAGNDQWVTLDSGQRETFDTGSQRDTRKNKGRYDLIPPIALKRWAQLMERGAEKYGERNWELGQPLGRYFDSATRHMQMWLMGETDEDHLAAALFNIGAIIWTQDQIARGNLPGQLNDVGVPIDVIEDIKHDYSGWGNNEGWQTE